MKSIKPMIYGGQGGIEGIIKQEGDIKVMEMLEKKWTFLILIIHQTYQMSLLLMPAHQGSMDRKSCSP
ncbi:hypothetical protein [Peribacillus frigoritolerans]|uniref:hypothetical protein n=1 Tax=Peribacillus frigoritolerans TaxID=450367 RepID=UPI00399EF8B7